MGLSMLCIAVDQIALSLTHLVMSLWTANLYSLMLGPLSHSILCPPEI